MIRSRVTSFVRVKPVASHDYHQSSEPQRLKGFKRKKRRVMSLIYTVTLNPAVTILSNTDHVETGAVNRMASEDKCFGGKGINVSRVLTSRYRRHESWVIEVKVSPDAS